MSAKRNIHILTFLPMLISVKETKGYCYANSPPAPDFCRNLVIVRGEENNFNDFMIKLKIFVCQIIYWVNY